jgi:PAS domain S-box-containing protein
MELDERYKKILDLDSIYSQVSNQYPAGSETRELLDSLYVIYQAISSTVGGVIIADLQGMITFVNPALLRMFGYETKEAMIGINAADLFATNEVRRFSDLQLIISISEGRTEEFTARRKDGRTFTVEVAASSIKNMTGHLVGLMASLVNITPRKKVEEDRERLIVKLQDALEKIKTLRGIIPICASCKNIRDDKGYWHKVESYVHNHSEADFSHGICPDCARKLYPDLKLHDDK